MHLIAQYGYGAVALAVGVESIGVPFPGETTLIAAALYAGATHQLNIVAVVAVAAIGAILGDNVGFLIGREFGFRLLVRYGHFIRMTKPRIKLGQYLFLRHGGKVVFFGRFAAVLRALAAFLAGANRMTWPRFLVFNAAGGSSGPPRTVSGHISLERQFIDSWGPSASYWEYWQCWSSPLARFF